MSYPRSILLSLYAFAALSMGCLQPAVVEPGAECIPGEVFNAADGCNTCSCPDSGLKDEAACTEIACIYEPCADKACGEGCLVCDPADADCVEPAVVSACNSEGACVNKSEDMCNVVYDPCADKTCGETCSTCDPANANCVQPAVDTACNTQGECVVNVPGLCQGGLCEGVTCPGTEATCEGNIAYPASSPGECNPSTGLCDSQPTKPLQNCEDLGMVCEAGACVSQGKMCGDTDTQCPDDSVCDIHGCGADASVTCAPMIDGCDEIYDPVCGCDGVEYANDCERVQFYGVALKHKGPCIEPSPCDPMDAQGEGPCDAEIGFVWNGSQCTSISGCSCVGEDCGSVYQTSEECETSHNACMAPYDPCADKACGEGCSMCDPKDEDCVNTPEVTVCSANGQCVSEPDNICPLDDSIPLGTCEDAGLVKSDAFWFQDAGFNGDTLVAAVSYSGGCAEHTFTACVSPFDVSDQALVNITIIHDANNDTCEAVITTTLSIDLEPLKKEWTAQTGKEHGEIPLAIEGLNESLLYTF